MHSLHDSLDHNASLRNKVLNALGPSTSIRKSKLRRALDVHRNTLRSYMLQVCPEHVLGTIGDTKIPVESALKLVDYMGAQFRPRRKLKTQDTPKVSA